MEYRKTWSKIFYSIQISSILQGPKQKDSSQNIHKGLLEPVSVQLNLKK